MASVSALVAMASETASVRLGRRAIADTVSAQGTDARSASRSSEVNSGESRMTGSATDIDVSRASRRISFFGAFGIYLTTSAIAARTRVASSSTNAVRS